MLVVTIGQDLTVHGDFAATHDSCHCTFAVVVQGDEHIDVDLAAQDVELHVHVTVVAIGDALVGHVALAGYLSIHQGRLSQV